MLVMALPVTELALLIVLPIAATAMSGEYQMGQREAGRERQTDIQCTACLPISNRNKVLEYLTLQVLTYSSIA